MTPLPRPVHRLDFRSRFAHLHTGDSLDRVSQRFARVGEQHAVERLHLSDPGRTLLGQGFLGW